MKRFRLIGAALLALLAFGALTAASASAATFLLAEWLVSGADVTTELDAEASGELLLEDTSLKAAILCSVVFTGWVGPNSLDFISEILTLGLISSGTPLVPGSGIACAAQTGCAASPSPEIWPVNLPWETEVELMEDTTTFFADLITAKNGSGVGYELECTILGVKSTDECTASQAAFELTLDGSMLIGNFSEVFTELAGLKLGKCTFSGTETGIVEGSLEYALPGGGELEASSEGVIS